jgi:hypothetical protein
MSRIDTSEEVYNIVGFFQLNWHNKDISVLGMHTLRL